MQAAKLLVPRPSLYWLHLASQHCVRAGVPAPLRLGERMAHSIALDVPGPAAAVLSALPSMQILSCPPPDVGAAPLLCTHNGTFHADEALAVGLLRCLPEYAAADVVRTRQQSHIDACTVVVDVGGVYDAARLRFDHHQSTFKDTYSSAWPHAAVKLSSAGLVYKHFGRRIIRSFIGAAAAEETVDTLVRKVYDRFVLELDAIDNGVETHSKREKGDADEPQLYSIHTGLSSRVGRLNPSWNEPSDDAAVNRHFRAAVELTLREFAQCVHSYMHSWLPAREIVAEALQQARAVHASGRILRLRTFCPWKEHLAELEAPGEPQALYVLYQDTSSAWRVQAVPVTPDSFECRRPLPRPWRGLRDAQLVEAAGVDGASFVHAGGFIGGATNFDSALAMAAKALDIE